MNLARRSSQQIFGMEEQSQSSIQNPSQGQFFKMQSEQSFSALDAFGHNNLNSNGLIAAHGNVANFSGSVISSDGDNIIPHELSLFSNSDEVPSDDNFNGEDKQQS